MTDHETRKRLIITRHLAKMTPEEIGRRFVVTYTAPLKQKSSDSGRSGALKRHTGNRD